MLNIPALPPGGEDFVREIVATPLVQIAMAPVKTLVALSAVTGAALAGPMAGSPCASVSAAVAGAEPSSVPTVPAQLAYDCLQSVPLGKDNALELVDAIKPYFNWQSSTAYLKTPPEEYAEKIQEAVDIFAGLDEVRSKVESGEYKSEYDFGWELYTLLQSTQ